MKCVSQEADHQGYYDEHYEQDDDSDVRPLNYCSTLPPSALLRNKVMTRILS